MAATIERERGADVLVPLDPLCGEVWYEDEMSSMKFNDEATLGGGAAETKDPEALMRRVELESELGVNFKRVRQLLVELLHEHPRPEVERILEGMLAQIPEDDSLANPDRTGYAEEYREAVDQLKIERQQFLGMADLLKGLLMWVETPGERVHKNRVLKTGSDY